MEIVIVYDVEQDHLHMEHLVMNCGQLQREDVQSSLFDGGESFLENLRPGQFSIVFLALFMSGIDGMETDREMHRRGYTCQLVFVTSSDSYAIQDYEVDAATIY